MLATRRMFMLHVFLLTHTIHFVSRSIFPFICENAKRDVNSRGEVSKTRNNDESVLLLTDEDAESRLKRIYSRRTFRPELAIHVRNKSEDTSARI